MSASVCADTPVVLPSFWYICNFCTKKFKHKITLKRHIFSCHCFERNCKITCSIDGCMAELNNKICLRKHVQRHHRGKLWELPKRWYHISHITCVNHPTSSESLNIDLPERTDNIMSVHTSSLAEIGPLANGTLNNLRMEQPIVPPTTTFDCEMLEDKSLQSEEDDDVLTYKSTISNISQRKCSMSISLCQLKCKCNLTENNLVVIQDWAEELLQECVTTIIGGLKYHAESSFFTKEVCDVVHLGRGLANPFHGIRNESQRKKLIPCFVVSFFLFSCCFFLIKPFEQLKRHLALGGKKNSAMH